MSDLFSTENKYKKSQKSREMIDEFGEKQIIVGVLIRVSTDAQAQDGDSLEMQEDMARKHVEEVDGIIYNYYIEEGVSASKTRIEKRTKLQELIQDVRDGKINYIVSYRRDRLFRNTQEYMWFIQFLADNNCNIFLTAQGEQQIDLSAFQSAGASKMMEVVMSMIAEMESATTSTRVSDTMINLAKKGQNTGGNTPIGYHKEGDNLLSIDGAKETVIMIEDLYLNGYGIFSIARWLNGGEVKGLRTLESPIRKPISPYRETIWNHRNIDTVLFNPIYTGHFSYQSKKNLDIDRIITKSDKIEIMRTEERQREINKLKNKKSEGNRPPRAYNTPFLLSGLIYCAECGEKFLTSTTQTKDGKRHSYYRCKSKGTTYNTIKCGNQGYRKEILEHAVLQVAKERIKLFSEPETYKLLKAKVEDDKVSYDSQADKVKKKIKELDKNLNKYTNLVGALDDDLDLQKVYMKKQKEILMEMNELKETHAILLEKIDSDLEKEYDFEEFLKLTQTFGDIIEESPVPIQKQLLENLFSDIYINKEGQVKLKIRVGLADIGSEVSDDGTQDDTEVVIGFGTGGSPMVVKDIITLSPQFTIEFNYFDFIYEITDILFGNLEEYLGGYDENVLLNNALNIDISILKDYKNRKYKDDFLLKKSINSSYLIEKYKLNYVSLNNYRNNSGIGLNQLKLMIDTAGGSLDEYLALLKEEYRTMVTDEDILNIYIKTANERDKNNNSILFQNKIKCKCGGHFVRKKAVHTKSYVCVNRLSCHTVSIREMELIQRIQVDLGVTVKNRKDIDELVNIVQVYDERRKFKVLYN